MFHSTSGGEDMSNKAKEYLSKRFKYWGKIRFESHNNLLLFMQEHE